MSYSKHCRLPPHLRRPLGPSAPPFAPSRCPIRTRHSQCLCARRRCLPTWDLPPGALHSTSLSAYLHSRSTRSR